MNQSPPFDWPVERGKIEEFARALGDENPDHFGPNAIALPTFPTTALNFWQPPDTRQLLGFDFDPARILHGEQRYTYERPIRAGDRLQGVTTLGDIKTKEGKAGGTMRIAELVTTFTDEDNAVVASATALAIERQQATSSSAPSSAPQASVAEPIETEPTDLIVEDVGIKNFVRYCGASGDFNPIHYDEKYAKAAGYPTYFGVGMFTAGVMTRHLTDLYGAGSVKSFHVRFTGIVWEGDTLICRAIKSDENLTLSVTDAYGSSRLTGSATLF